MELLRPMLVALNLFFGILMGVLAGISLADHNIGWFVYDFFFSFLNFIMFVYWISKL